jgi:hypothetical protein
MWNLKGLAVVLALCLAGAARAENTPCSGRKGGISHCQGDKFVCNNGTISASKKDCSRVFKRIGKTAPRGDVPKSVFNDVKGAETREVKR